MRAHLFSMRCVFARVSAASFCLCMALRLPSLPAAAALEEGCTAASGCNKDDRFGWDANCCCFSRPCSKPWALPGAAFCSEGTGAVSTKRLGDCGLSRRPSPSEAGAAFSLGAARRAGDSPEECRRGLLTGGLLPPLRRLRLGLGLRPLPLGLPDKRSGKAGWGSAGTLGSRGEKGDAEREEVGEAWAGMCSGRAARIVKPGCLCLGVVGGAFTKSGLAPGDRSARRAITASKK